MAISIVGKAPLPVRDETEDEPTKPTRPVGITGGYRPALDGVRAIAIAMVVVFHLDVGGLAVLNGGWLGVDVFFVLSGYLITSLLLAERRRQNRIDLRRFYARRFLRLAPLSVALVLMLWAGHATGLTRPLGLELPWRSGVSILAYYSNWWFIAHPDQAGSFGHAWSLSLEEQFYFIWPWIVIGIIALARQRSRAALAVFTALAIIAIDGSRRVYWWGSTRPGTRGDDVVRVWNNVFQNSFLRGDGLLYGCLLAILLHRWDPSSRLRRALGALAVPAIAVAAAIVGAAHFRLWQPWVAFIPVWGLSMFNVCVTLVVAWVVLVPRSPLALALSQRPFTWIGRRAYGIYLIHPLVLDSFRYATSIRGGALDAVVITITLVLAGLSFRYFETPFLRLKERFTASPPVGPTALAAIGTIGDGVARATPEQRSPRWTRKAPRSS